MEELPNVVNGRLPTISCSGLIEKLPITKFVLKLRILGSFLALYVNGIKVLASSIPFSVDYTQVDIWVRSNGKATINNYKIECKKSEVFIVSQFGDDYDVLYNEVIAPVCEDLGYTPICGDEVVSCTLILNDIITSTRNSAVIIADITPDNIF